MTPSPTALLTLTRAEKNLLADALNACTILIAFQPDYLQQMSGDGGAIRDAAVIGTDAQGRVTLTGSGICSGLELEVYDSMRICDLERKWDVDGTALLAKIRAMTPAEREHVIRGIGLAWEHCDDNTE